MRQQLFLSLLTLLFTSGKPLFGTILVYNDEGVSSFCLNCLLEELTRIFHGISKGDEQNVTPNSFTGNREHCQIDKARGSGGEFGVTDCSASPREHEIFGLNPFHPKTIDANALLTTDWEENTSLLIMPGGRDLPYQKKLKGEGNRRIRAFVENGGSYLGICAGAYYGSNHVLFDEGGELEVLGERELSFYPGIAKGPAYGVGTYHYLDHKSAKASPITLYHEETPTTARFYYNGGCLFVDPEKHTNTRVLGRYSDLPNHPAALIECQVGKGIAILSGVHFEIASAHLEKEKQKNTR